MRSLGRILHALIGDITRHLPGWRAQRVRIVLRNQAGDILLVKTWLSQQRWALPGGGVEKAETPEQAAVRELHEETGLEIAASSLRYLATTQSERLQADLLIYTARVATTELPSLHWPYTWEIIDRTWVATEAIPTSVSEHTKHAIELALETEN